MLLCATAASLLVMQRPGHIKTTTRAAVAIVTRTLPAIRDNLWLLPAPLRMSGRLTSPPRRRTPVGRLQADHWHWQASESLGGRECESARPGDTAAAAVRLGPHWHPASDVTRTQRTA